MVPVIYRCLSDCYVLPYSIANIAVESIYLRTFEIYLPLFFVLRLIIFRKTYRCKEFIRVIEQQCNGIYRRLTYFVNVILLVVLKYMHRFDELRILFYGPINTISKT